MPSDPDAAVELADLRARAYGPDADIDAFSLARLRVLEEAAGRARDVARHAAGARTDADEEALARTREPPDEPFAALFDTWHDADDTDDTHDGDGDNTTRDDPRADAAASSTESRHRRGRRVSLGIAAVAVALVAFAAGQIVQQAGTPQAAGWHTTVGDLVPRAAESYQRVADIGRNWDKDSLYFVGSVNSRFVWLGTTDSGATTCIVVDAAPTTSGDGATSDASPDSGPAIETSGALSGLACAATADVTGASIGYATVATTDGATRVDQYSVDLHANGAPALRYTQTGG